MQTYDTIVVGAGGVGSAVMHSLAKRGLRVLGIDRFDPPHDRGSSHGQTRVIRQAYFEHPDYVPLLRRTYDLWAAIEESSGEQLFTRCGLLEVGPEDGEVVPGVLRAATEHSLAVQTLSPREVTTRWPALRVPDGLTAVFEPTAGYLRVESCVAKLLDCATQLGAMLRTHCEVRSWRATGSSVEVVTSEGTYSAGSLVIAAGAWAGAMLADLGVPLKPLRKTMFWYPVASVPQATKLPVYLYELDFGVHYGFPSLNGQTLKAAEHTGGTPVDDLLEVDESTLAGEQALVERFLEQCVAGANRPPTAHASCLYTMTPDHHFVVDRHPRHANVAFAAGLSGHGFKFTPVLGEALADLIVDGQTKLPIEFLRLERLG